MRPSKLVVYGALALVGLVSVLITKLALFVLILTFIAALSLPSDRPRSLVILTSIAGVAAFGGFMRFLVIEAVPGIVQGGTRAAEGTAVSRLREILFAEDSLRKHPLIDPDRDGIGSAALLGELTGAHPVRGGQKLAAPLLERYAAPVEVSPGPAIEMGGFFFIVCLPASDGSWTARPEQPIDDERAERQFVAYAWPSNDERHFDSAYFMDEHERILVSDVSTRPGARKRIGTDAPPACDDALAPASRGEWRTWRGKRARQHLPGDRS